MTADPCLRQVDEEILQPFDAKSNFNAAGSMSNTSSNANSGYKLEHDLACLAEMFPSVDCKVLRNYLEIFSDQANHLSVIIDMLLQGERSNLDQNATQEQSAIKQKIAREDCNSCSVEAGIEELSPNKLQRRDSSCSDTDSLPPMLGEGELDGKAKVLGSNESELLTSCSENSDKKEVNTVKSLKCNSDNDDCDIVLVKIVESSARKSFHRTSNCISKSGTTSPSRHNGICIRYKGGVFHPSMTKPRKPQIVEIDADGKSCTGNNNTQSLSNRDQSKSGQSPGRKRQSIAKPSYSKTSTVVHCAEPSDSGKEVLMVEEIRSRKEGLSATASVSDLEILKKVFPDADPIQIGLLLEKYANEPNKVALVGKELGNKPDTQAHSLRRKVLLPRVTWFWESGDNKLVPFTDSECNVLEKEFQNCKSDYSGVASDKLAAIMLPGSTKSVKVNFFKMTMACSNNGTKSHIFRVPEGNEENKEISGKCLIPQEALTVPNDWQQQSKGAELVRVRPGSAEWDHVLGSLKRSIKKAVVVNVQRVQNKWLYRKYAIQRHLLKEKNGVASINEKELFHGTRQTSPKAIWRGEDGFDMRYSADGMWGRGAYFASEASYSHHGFVYHDAQTQHFQLFLAHVLTGDSISLPPDHNLKMPPLKKGSNIRYDSINGVANNCTVYILYKLDMAYPAYLITYTVTNNRR